MSRPGPIQELQLVKASRMLGHVISKARGGFLLIQDKMILSGGRLALNLKKMMSPSCTTYPFPCSQFLQLQIRLS
jgi:hypothetical protein